MVMVMKTDNIAKVEASMFGLDWTGAFKKAIYSNIIILEMNSLLIV